MPIYSYKCENENCSKITEEIFPITSFPQRIVCPECSEGESTGSEAVLVPSILGNFKINGDNSASTAKRTKN